MNNISKFQCDPKVNESLQGILWKEVKAINFASNVSVEGEVSAMWAQLREGA